jgi:hypothetical protein
MATIAHRVPCVVSRIERSRVESRVGENSQNTTGLVTKCKMFIFIDIIYCESDVPPNIPPGERAWGVFHQLSQSSNQRADGPWAMPFSSIAVLLEPEHAYHCQLRVAAAQMFRCAGPLGLFYGHDGQRRARAKRVRPRSVTRL